MPKGSLGGSPGAFNVKSLPWFEQLQASPYFGAGIGLLSANASGGNPYQAAAQGLLSSGTSRQQFEDRHQRQIDQEAREKILQLLASRVGGANAL